MPLDWHDELKTALALKKARGSERLTVPRGAVLALTLEPSGEIRLSKRLPTTERGAGRGCSLAAKRQDAAHLSIAKNPEKTGKGKAGHGLLPGLKKFGSSAKRAVKNACGALKAIYGRRIVFATLTLAGSTDDARKALAAYSGYVVELLQKWISYQAPDAMWVYKWEWQKSGALHLHAAIGSHDLLHLRALEKAFKSYVFKLHQQLSKKSGLDCFARAEGGSWRAFPQMMRSNCQPVRKCVKRYMAKYITKAGAGVQGYCPARWWGQSRALLAAVGALRRGTSWNIQMWELAAQAWQTAAAILRSLSKPTFEYSCPFRPGDVTLLHYSPDEDVGTVYHLVYRELAARLDLQAASR